MGVFSTESGSAQPIRSFARPLQAKARRNPDARELRANGSREGFEGVKGSHLRKSDGKPILGIELDDKSHQRADRAKRDAFVSGVFTSATLPLLHVKAQATYDPREVLRQIASALNSPLAVPPLDSTA